MRLTLMYDGRDLGEVEFGEPDAERGLRTGRLAPTAAYLAARPDLQVLPEADLPALAGAAPEAIRDSLAAGLTRLASRGLALSDAGRPVPTTFLLVGDYFPADTDLETLAALGVTVSAALAPPA